MIPKLISYFMRLFFHLLYHSFAWSYNVVAGMVSFGRWKDWVRASLKLVSGPRVLELGFGPGHLQVSMTNAGMIPFGLDESWQMTRQARKRLMFQDAPARLARGQAQRLPYMGQAFNGVVATFPTRYILQPEALAEVRRVLKPGGRLVVLWAAWITGEGLKERLLRGVYQATHESPAEDVELARFILPYQQAGFNASLRFVALPGARLMFVIAYPA